MMAANYRQTKGDTEMTIENAGYKTGRLAAHLKAGLEMQDVLMDLLCAIGEYQETHKPPKCCNLEAAICYAWKKSEDFDDCHQEDMELAACQIMAGHILQQQREREERWRKEQQEWQAKQKKAKAPKARTPKVKLAKAA
jgi:hypothetical protein